MKAHQILQIPFENFLILQIVILKIMNLTFLVLSQFDFFYLFLLDIANALTSFSAEIDVIRKMNKPTYNEQQILQVIALIS